MDKLELGQDFSTSRSIIVKCVVTCEVGNKLKKYPHGRS